MTIYLPISVLPRGSLQAGCVLPTLNSGARPRPESMTWKSGQTESATGALDAGAARPWCWSSLAVQERLQENDGQGEGQEVGGIPSGSHEVGRPY